MARSFVSDVNAFMHEMAPPYSERRGENASESKKLN